MSQSVTLKDPQSLKAPRISKHRLDELLQGASSSSLQQTMPWGVGGGGETPDARPYIVYEYSCHIVSAHSFQTLSYPQLHSTWARACLVAVHVGNRGLRSALKPFWRFFLLHGLLHQHVHSMQRQTETRRTPCGIGIHRA